MINRVDNISTVLAPLQTNSGKSAGAVELGKSFGDMLNQAVQQLSEQEKVVGELNDSFIRGETVDVHQLLINAERLSLGLDMTVQIRNKVVEAYQDIMRTQI